MSVYRRHRRSLIGCDEQTIQVASPEKKKAAHNPEDTATAKSHLVPLNKASADEPFAVPVIVELVEMILLDDAFLTVEPCRSREDPSDCRRRASEGLEVGTADARTGCLELVGRSS